MNWTQIALRSGAAIVLLLWLEHTRGAAVGDITASKFVMKNGRCYRVDTMANGSTRSVAVDGGQCARDQSDGTHISTFDESDYQDLYEAGFGKLRDLFADITPED